MRTLIILLFLLRLSSLFGQSRQESDSLTKVLGIVYERDQIPRNQLDSIKNRYGYNSIQVAEQWKVIEKNDSANIQIVVSILDNYGWLGERNTSKTT